MPADGGVSYDEDEMPADGGVSGDADTGDGFTEDGANEALSGEDADTAEGGAADGT